MIDISMATATLAGAALAVLLAGGAWLLFTGLRARGEAGEVARLNARLEALMAASPACLALVRRDGRLDMPERLADWLGLAGVPRFVADLAGDGTGLSADDVAALAADIATAHKAGRPFNRAVRAQGSNRTLLVRGEPAASALEAPGSVVLWTFDATESEAEIRALAEEGDRLRQAFEALTGLIEAAPLPMWYRGPDLRLQMVNSAYVGAVEADDAHAVVSRGIELVEGAGMGGPLAGAGPARDSGAPQEHMVPATIGGARRMLRIVDVPLPTGGVAGFAIDVEDLEQARGGLRRFVTAQRTMLDRLSAGVAQFGADRTLSFCNQPFRRMFAMRSEWLADRPEFDRVLERMRETNRVPEVRDFPGWKLERREWFTATTGGIEENWHLPGGAHLRVLAQPLPDGGLLLIFEDRTEQVQLASARDTLLRVRTATFDNLFEALGVFAADGRLQLWNNRFARVWAFEDEFLSGHPRVDALAEKAADKLSDPSRATLIGELVRAATVERQQRGGHVEMADGRHFQFAAVPLPDGNALFTMLDVTDRQRIEQALRDRAEALEAADRVKTAFVANMSYELRTPLTSISGFAELLHGGYAGKLPKAAEGYLDSILEAATRLGTLIDEVLDLTREDAEQPELDIAEVDLVAEAQAAADAVATVAAQRALDFAVEIASSVGSAQGDARRLRQSIEHLLQHAIAGTPEGGRILLHADGTASHARIVVSDNGPGMDAEAVSRAFDRFARPGVTSTGERALGLDLPLAKQFVEAHGGTIELVSAPGEGTLITVELPRRR